MKKKVKPRWTPLEIDQLLQATADGKTAKEIGVMLGRTHKSVKLKRQRLGVKISPKVANTPLRLAELIKFRMAGWTLKKIAKVYDVQESRICSILCQNGFKGFLTQKGGNSFSTFWTEIELHRLRKLCGYFHENGGFSKHRWEQIARHFPNRTTQAVEAKGIRMKRYWRSPEEIRERQYLRAKYKRMMTVNWSTIGKLERR